MTAMPMAVLSAAVVLLMTAQFALGQEGRPQVPPGAFIRDNVVRVMGEGQVQVEPDRATVRLGATVRAREAGEAQQQVNTIMRRALEAVRELGVEERNIRTTELSIWPMHEHPRPNERGQPQEPRIVGYQASNVITVEVSELEKIGPVIDACIAAGANQLQGVQFDLREDTEARGQALRRAVEQARQKAAVLAEAAGHSLGDLLEVTEAGVEWRPPEPIYGARAMAAEADAATPVQPGQITVTARVTLVHRLERNDGQ